MQLGGTISGEHGVGVEKLNQMCSQFDRPTLDAFGAIKSAFDPQRPAQSRQSRADTASLRRVRQDAGARRHDAISRAAALLMQAATRPSAAERTDPRRGRGRQAVAGARRGQQGLLRQHAARHGARSACAARHRQLRAKRAGDGGVLRNAASAKSSATLRCRRPDAGVRAAAFWRRRHDRRLIASGLAGPRRARAATPMVACVISYWAPNCSMAARNCCTFGGMVMKNVAGYDVARLLAGSLGNIGRDRRGVVQGRAEARQADHAAIRPWTSLRR